MAPNKRPETKPKKINYIFLSIFLLILNINLIESVHLSPSNSLESEIAKDSQHHHSEIHIRQNKHHHQHHNQHKHRSDRARRNRNLIESFNDNNDLIVATPIEKRTYHSKFTIDDLYYKSYEMKVSNDIDMDPCKAGK